MARTCVSADGVTLEATTDELGVLVRIRRRAWRPYVTVAWLDLALHAVLAVLTAALFLLCLEKTISPSADSERPGRGLLVWLLVLGFLAYVQFALIRWQIHERLHRLCGLDELEPRGGRVTVRRSSLVPTDHAMFATSGGRLDVPAGLAQEPTAPDRNRPGPRSLVHGSRVAQPRRGRDEFRRYRGLVLRAAPLTGCMRLSIAIRATRPPGTSGPIRADGDDEEWACRIGDGVGNPTARELLAGAGGGNGGEMRFAAGRG